MKAEVEAAYVRAKEGDWAAVLTAWGDDPNLAAECAQYVKPSSGWTFLHQAAFFGHERAVRELIRLGASTDTEARDHLSAADIARQRGHHTTADLLERAASGASELWSAPHEVGVLPSSHLWAEATERTAPHELVVCYGGGRTVIAEGARYYVDSFERVLVGWHGTTSPPRDMDGRPTIDVPDPAR